MFEWPQLCPDPAMGTSRAPYLIEMDLAVHTPTVGIPLADPAWDKGAIALFVIIFFVKMKLITSCNL